MGFRGRRVWRRPSTGSLSGRPIGASSRGDSEGYDSIRPLYVVESAVDVAGREGLLGAWAIPFPRTEGG